MYPSTSLFVCIGRLSIVILTLCSYPLQVHPCRAALDKVFSRQSSLIVESTQGNQRTSVYHDQTNSEEDALYPNDELNRDAAAVSQVSITSPRLEEMSNQKLCILTGLILASTFVIALCVDDLGLILGFVGSVGSTSISFIVSKSSIIAPCELIPYFYFYSFPAFYSAHYIRRVIAVNYVDELKFSQYTAVSS